MRLEQHIEAVIVKILDEMSEDISSTEHPPTIEDVKAEVFNRVMYEMELAELTSFAECAIAKAQGNPCKDNVARTIEELELAESSCMAT